MSIIILCFIYCKRFYQLFCALAHVLPKRAPGAPAGTREDTARAAENAEIAEIAEIAENCNDPGESLLL